jgi:SAM-dependent methyltransferase
MAHQQQRDFIAKVKSFFPEFFDGGLRVLEVGSLNINGTVRDFFGPRKGNGCYIGIDIIDGKDVDIVCAGKDYGTAGHDDGQTMPFDFTISTECFEHDKDWVLTFDNMWQLTKPGGLIVFTCASEGRHEHGTTRTSPQDSPATTDYYKNLTEKDFKEVCDFNEAFSKYAFEYNPVTCDLYFWGVKK